MSAGQAALAAARACAVMPIRNAPRLGPPLLLAALGAIAVLYHATFWSMLQLWSRSQTFAHGYAIVPICAWLVWRQRGALAAAEQRPSIAGLVLIGLLGAAWLLADAANVQVVGQYAATALLPAAVLAICGWRYARAIAFPLGYLMLAVPFGEVFVPPLIEFTARFTVGALQWTGVPVFRENNNFSIPSGNWSVVEACSGLRYVIASLALGALYAHLNYRSARRRLLFIAVALLLPILANGVRAYLIVMLGHWSGMRLAAGVDHLLYGWFFFGLVSLLLYWVGGFWRDGPAPPDAPAVAAPRWPDMRAASAAAAAACVALAALWPWLAVALPAAPTRPAPGAALAVAAAPGWRAVDTTAAEWRAPHAGAPLQLIQRYQGAPGFVGLQLAWYRRQGKDAELLAHVAPARFDGWSPVADGARSVRVGARALALRQSVWQNGAARLLVWRWYRQGGVDTASAFAVKLRLAGARLTRGAEDGADIIVSAPYGEHEPEPQAALGAFLADMLPAIDKALDDVRGH
ncbi:exosortase A [Janthinobacterium fluminis]|uniref:Exosortase A n=1 Tax=Janthinobacterium fluminis TaxID=2987524 RepID=A0ABT5JVV9_9BURK|nr:exosortase A [Janthinobacterium fluminis]MDC8756863.1 exosortase A [Janthinobacterium fluminis]